MRTAALAAALCAAAVLPGERLGLAVPVIAALVLATCLPAARRSAAAAACTILAVALAAQAALLDASWISLRPERWPRSPQAGRGSSRS
jgi:hypothetical protein